MIKTALLCALSGIMLILAGSFGDFKATQDSRIAPSKHNKLCFFVQSSTLNVRNAPSLEAKIIHQLPQNSKICEYFETHNGFLHTQEGWIATKYLNLEPKKPNYTRDSALALQNHSNTILNYQVSNKPKFKLTSTTKNSTSIAQNQKSMQSPIMQARAAMDNQNYTRAKNLALRANLANPKDSESWEIFAKSTYLEGNPEEAILILQNFLQQNNNEDLTNLLKQMQQGQKI